MPGPCGEGVNVGGERFKPPLRGGRRGEPKERKRMGVARNPGPPVNAANGTSPLCKTKRTVPKAGPLSEAPENQFLHTLCAVPLWVCPALPMGCPSMGYTF